MRKIRGLDQGRKAPCLRRNEQVMLREPQPIEKSYIRTNFNNMKIYWNKIFGFGFVANTWCRLDDNDCSRSRMCLEFKIIILNLMICGTFPIGRWKSTTLMYHIL